MEEQILRITTRHTTLNGIKAKTEKQDIKNTEVLENSKSEVLKSFAQNKNLLFKHFLGNVERANLKDEKNQ